MYARIALVLAMMVALAGCSEERPTEAVATTVAQRVGATASTVPPSPDATERVTATEAPSESAAAPAPEPMADGMLNLTHLNMLSEEAQVDGRPVLITHIYSEAPRYTWVDASGEGIAALDDVARDDCLPGLLCEDR